MAQQDPFLVSDWNTGMPSGFRLHYAFFMANHFAGKQDYFNYMQQLIRVFMETSSKLTQPEFTIAQTQRRQIRNAHNIIVKHKCNSRTKKTIALKESQLIVMLEDWEVLLRSYADKHGLLMPNKEDPSKAIFR